MGCWMDIHGPSGEWENDHIYVSNVVVRILFNTIIWPIQMITYP